MTEIPDQTVGVGYTIMGWAAGFNHSVGYVGDVSVVWTADTFGGANASTTPSSGTNSTFDAGRNALEPILKKPFLFRSAGLLE